MSKHMVLTWRLRLVSQWCFVMFLRLCDLCDTVCVWFIGESKRFGNIPQKCFGYPKMRGRCVILPSKTVTKRRLRGSERQKLVSFALLPLGLSPWFLRTLCFVFIFWILTARHGLLMGFYFYFFSSLNFTSRPLELEGPPGKNLRGECWFALSIF